MVMEGGRISAIQTHMKHLLEEPAGKAIYRIVQYMGYQDYLTRSQIKDNKLDTLRFLRHWRVTNCLVERLSELQQIIKEKPPDYSCPFILSTIHASKGLEYDTVYLLDVIDGICRIRFYKIPERHPKKNWKAMRKNAVYFM
ncbi:MAG: 3'-5' exonuclease [Clostridium sp.]